MSRLERALGLIRTVPDFPEPGVLFRDMTPLFASGDAFAEVCAALAASLPPDTDMIAAVDARGFLLGGAVAVALGCGVVPVRKPGKLPVVADRVEYSLEYGTASLELPAGALRSGERVAVVDDLLATGGTVDAVCQLVERAGADVVVVAVVAELTALGGRARLRDRPVKSLVSF